MFYRLSLNFLSIRIPRFFFAYLLPSQSFHFPLSICATFKAFWSVANACGLGSSSWNWDNLILHTSVIFVFWFSPKNSSVQANKINIKSHSLLPKQLPLLPKAVVSSSGNFTFFLSLKQLWKLALSKMHRSDCLAPVSPLTQAPATWTGPEEQMITFLYIKIFLSLT